MLGGHDRPFPDQNKMLLACNTDFGNLASPANRPGP